MIPYTWGQKQIVKYSTNMYCWLSNVVDSQTAVHMKRPGLQFWCDNVIACSGQACFVPLRYLPARDKTKVENGWNSSSTKLRNVKVHQIRKWEIRATYSLMVSGLRSSVQRGRSNRKTPCLASCTSAVLAAVLHLLDHLLVSAVVHLGLLVTDKFSVKTATHIHHVSVRISEFHMYRSQVMLWTGTHSFGSIICSAA